MSAEETKIAPDERDFPTDLCRWGVALCALSAVGTLFLLFSLAVRILSWHRIGRTGSSEALITPSVEPALFFCYDTVVFVSVSEWYPSE